MSETQIVIKKRIQHLRELMLSRGVKACVVLSADPHLSEYLPEHWQTRAWLSGFQGSAGTLLVTPDFAGLWTDSRYWEQAIVDLTDTDIELMRAGQEGVPSPSDWLVLNLAAGDCVAVDGDTLSVAAHRQWLQVLSGSAIRLQTDLDLPGEVWADRPALPHAPVYAHASHFAGRSRADKLAAVRKEMSEKKAQWHWLSSLDDIAWILNLRGQDVAYNPVFLSHFLIGERDARLFIDQSKIPDELRRDLEVDGIVLESYDALAGVLACLPESDTLLFDPARTTAGLLSSAAFVKQCEADNPSQIMKACKTEAELAHIRETMEMDGAALCEFFAWFEDRVGKERVSELMVDERITAARARRPHFVCPSFSTIAAFNANGAMPHYQATEQSHAWIEGDGLLLIDSGGQYLGGTTDITRVVPIGTLTASQKHDYTLVLKGMIALSQAVFPKGVAGSTLDVLARMPLWQSGLEFGHGTGHGVGYFLNVHEGPQSISYRAPRAVPMQVGMVTSNEPGLYRPGQWGIRIENLIACQPARQTDFGDFLQFETLTLCPIDTRCIEPTLMTDTDRQWLNHYHGQVRQRLLPHVSGAAKNWLITRTEPL
ncbi:aminopeptidase P family protein [Pusillimonas sp. DMV24BSW_D]|uniref:aminopeptidase P family protein n=1 Tax=Neopusillimonas aestuarii TaxID=2716226 RepID=UPI00140765B2|nr:aminopeptidase P family protein [Pusillimonas sp. DMV24BSW_D]QIM49164.1 aminopeptidase P family protein [Pusillimonas sp. DMV24BSW_D]